MIRKTATLLTALLCLTALASCKVDEVNSLALEDTEASRSETEQCAEPFSAPCVVDNSISLISDDGFSINIEISYPTVQLLDSDISEGINKTITNFVDSVYSHYYDLPSLSAVKTINSTMLYDVVSFNDDFISIHFLASFAGSGATEYVNDTCYTFDLKTGSLMPLTAFYEHSEITAAINNYFDRLDEDMYPTLFALYSADEIKNDFLNKFDPEARDYDSTIYNSYYITENKLVLFAGYYKGYTVDIESPLQGDRAFILELDLPAISVPTAVTEPPLTDRDLSMAVPDFLTEEQQLLYRRARNIYSHLFGGSPDFAEYSETLDYTVGNYDRFEKDGDRTYLISQGRYQNWDDFMSLVLSAFTEDFFDNKNRTASDFPRFVEYNGKLAFPDGVRGGGLYYNSNFQDEFELVSINDTEIVFNVIGHYSYLYPHDGESFEERDARCDAGWDMTDKFTLRMILTEDGWRFDEFYHPAIDERSDILGNILMPRLNATENTASPLQFSFTAVDDAYYFSFGLLDGSTKMIDVPNTETELYVLVMDGRFALYLPEKTEYGIMLPGRAFADYGHGQNISLDSLISAGCKAEIVELSSSSYYGYTLNAIVVETEDAESRYTAEDAKSIIYNEINAQYEALVQEIALGGEVTLTHSEDRIQAILDDAQSYCASQVEYTGSFGRYYVFTGSRFGYPIYFNKYTGEIFSDNTANTISAVNIKKGIYSLAGLYW